MQDKWAVPKEQIYSFIRFFKPVLFLRIFKRQKTTSIKIATQCANLYTIPCTGLVEEFCPCWWIEECGFELRSELCVRKIWRIVCFHEVYAIVILSTLPVPPEPFWTEWRNGEHSPMDEYSDFKSIIPFRKWSRIQGFPIGLIFYPWHKIGFDM